MARNDVSEDVFFLDRALQRPLQAQIRETVVNGILSRQLLVGARMPSTRLLARHLGVARVTVTTAFQELVAQGYLRSSDRSAFVVADSAPVPRVRTGPDLTGDPRVDWMAKIPNSLEKLRRVFDLGAWRDCARQAMGRRDFEDMAGDVAAADDPMLVDYICARTLPRRGITAKSDQVLVTLGAQNALWLAIQLLVRDGFHAVVENPGHPDITSALRWLGARITAIDVDGEGLPTESLPDELDAVFVTPSHHAPTAVTMPMHRRQLLLSAAADRGFSHRRG